MTLQRKSPALFESRAALRLALFACCMLYAIVQTRYGIPLFASFQLLGNDDMMRILSVRDFLDGQGWYDMRQYRVLPPEGLSLHWSRLVDLPLLVIYQFFALGFDHDFSLKMAATLWPVLLFLIYLAVILRTTRVVFGRSAAAFAIMAATAIPPITSLFFPIGRVDHHNLQILLMTVMTAMLILDRRPESAGLWGGIAAGLSLAVGLETVPFVTLVSVIVLVMGTFGTPNWGRKALTYGTGLCVFAPLFFLAQTAPQNWQTPMCDQLSLPWLGLAASVFFVALVVQLLRNSGATRLTRGLAFFLLSAVFVAVLWPMLAPCREGPFSNMDPALRDMIFSGISESLPLITHFQKDWTFAAPLAGPHLLLFAILFALLGFGALRQRHRAPALILLLLLSLGIAMMFYQIRALLPALAVSPFVFGLVADRLLNYRSYVPGFLAAIMLAVIALPSLPIQVSQWINNPDDFELGALQSQTKPSEQESECVRPDALQRLSALPTGRMLAGLNLGAGILFYTDHSVLAAPYHRQPAAYRNGMFIHETDFETVRRYAENADYLVLCVTARYQGENSVGQRLLMGELPDWATPIDQDFHPFQVFKLQL